MIESFLNNSILTKNLEILIIGNGELGLLDALLFGQKDTANTNYSFSSENNFIKVYELPRLYKIEVHKPDHQGIIEIFSLFSENDLELVLVQCPALEWLDLKIYGEINETVDSIKSHSFCTNNVTLSIDATKYGFINSKFDAEIINGTFEIQSSQISFHDDEVEMNFVTEIKINLSSKIQPKIYVSKSFYPSANICYHDLDFDWLKIEMVLAKAEYLINCITDADNISSSTLYCRNERMLFEWLETSNHIKYKNPHVSLDLVLDVGRK